MWLKIIKSHFMTSLTSTFKFRMHRDERWDAIKLIYFMKNWKIFGSKTIVSHEKCIEQHMIFTTHRYRIFHKDRVSVNRLQITTELIYSEVNGVVAFWEVERIYLRNNGSRWSGPVRHAVTTNKDVWLKLLVH